MNKKSLFNACIEMMVVVVVVIVVVMVVVVAVLVVVIVAWVFRGVTSLYYNYYF